MIRFGVIGTNWITDSFLEAARESDDFVLAAVYSRTEEQARKFAEKHGVANIYTDVEAMAGDGEIDAVYIASPNSFHAEQAIVCLNRGIHVLCEKPIASNSRELRNMIDAARSNRVVLMEAMKSTLMPNFQAVRDHLHEIGKVRRYFASYCQYSSRYDAYKQGTILNAFNPAFSNGALIDIGIYCIYPMIVLFGKPDRVWANGVMLESGVDGEGSLLFGYPDMDAVVMYSKIANSYLPSEIQGEAGSIVIGKINQPEWAEIRFKDGTVKSITRPQVDNTMVYEIQEFIGLIKRGQRESDVNSLAHSLWTMEMMDEARRQIGLVYPADTGNV